MYAPLAAAAHPYDIGRLFLESCTGTPASPENLRMADVAASLLCVALDDPADMGFAEFCATMAKRTDVLHDIVATANQIAIDRLIASGASVVAIEACMSRAAALTRAALRPGNHRSEDFQRSASAIV